MKNKIIEYRSELQEGEDPRVKEFQDFLRNLTNEKVENKITDVEYDSYIKKYDDIIKKYKTKK